jgi:MFS family permease
MSALGPVFGQLFDRYGPKYLLLIGSFLQVFGLVMASISTKYYQFLLSQGVCSALGVTAVSLSAIGCVSGWFNKKRGLAFGIMATGSSIGGIIFPILLNTLIDSVGYSWAMRTAAFIIAGMLVIANLTIRTHHPPWLMNHSKEQLAKPFCELPYVALLSGLALVPFGLYTPIDYLPTSAIMTGTNEKLS